jgi:nitrogen fixation NifU-like protein
MHVHRLGTVSGKQETRNLMDIDRGMPDLDALYRDVVLDHFRNPRGRRTVAAPTACNEGQNPVCGDHVKLGVRVVDGTIAELEVLGRGCAISTASGSMMAELLSGRTLDEAKRVLEAFKGVMRGEAPPAGVELGDLDALEGVKKFPVRVKCALLPWTTLEDLIQGLSGGGPAATTPSAPAADPGAPAPTKEEVFQALKPVVDPEIGIGLVDLGLVYGVDVDAEKRLVTVRMTLTTPACPYGPMLFEQTRQAVRKMPGVAEAKVELVWDPPWDPKTMASDMAKDALGIW